ncbi:MAG: PGPGW domain-containing protein [Nanoarchaeota archaeon]|nr:PGPGW domain-containing protein [Nanoarchaeota archaeon]
MVIKNLKLVKRTIKIVFGFTILLLGIALLVLPGPGIVVIVFGLIILATEYIWARKLLEKGKFGLNKLKIRAK